MSKKVSYKKLARMHNSLMELEKAMIKEGDKDSKRLGYHCYVCSTSISTVKLVPGTTAMRIDCARKGCKSIMLHTDSIYKDIKDVKDTYEWFRPDLNWLKKNRQRIQLLDHVFAGGLILRKII